MTEEHWPNIIMEWQLTGRHRRRQPRTTWMEGVQEEMAGQGLQDGDWEDKEGYLELKSDLQRYPKLEHRQ